MIEEWGSSGPRAGVRAPPWGIRTRLHANIRSRGPARFLVASVAIFEDTTTPTRFDDLDDVRSDNPGQALAGDRQAYRQQPGAAVATNGPAFVSGAAPGRVHMIRTDPDDASVVLSSMRGLCRAIAHATARGAHVISISLGGPWPSATLRRAVEDAVSAGVIVLAAAGNHVRFVVFPAALEEVIAVAASTIRDEPWSGSSRGDAVDITAPGASVWRARSRATFATAASFTTFQGG